MKVLEQKDFELSSRNSISKSGTLTNESGINLLGMSKDLPKSVLNCYNLVETKKSNNEELEKYIMQQQIKNNNNLSNFSPISQKQQNISDISDISFTNNTHSNQQQNNVQEICDNDKSRTPQFTNQYLLGMANIINSGNNGIITQQYKDTPAFNSPVNIINAFQKNPNNFNIPIQQAQKDQQLESQLQSTYNYQQIVNNLNTSQNQLNNSGKKSQQQQQQSLNKSFQEAQPQQLQPQLLQPIQQNKIQQLAQQIQHNNQKEETPTKIKEMKNDKMIDKDQEQRSSRFDNNISRSSSNKENVFRQNSPSGFNNWHDSNSPAIAGAIKTLQDKSKKLELENLDLKKHNQERDQVYQQMIDKLKRQQENEIQKYINSNDKLKQQLAKLEDDCANRQQLVSKIDLEKKLQDSENSSMKKELQKYNDQIKELQQEIQYLQKCNQILEDEKQKHLEQNAIEKDQLEEKQNVLEKIRDANKTLIEKLEQDIQQQKQQKQQIQEKYHYLENENNQLKKKIQFSEDENSNREKLYKNKIAQLEKDLSQLNEKINLEKQSLLKKSNAIDNYEEKIRTFKEEKKELTKELASQQQIITQFQKNQDLLEKSLQKAIKEKQISEEQFKKILEINEELTAKCIKECPQKSREQIYSIANKIKKIDQSKLKSSHLSYQEDQKRSAKKTGRSKSKSPRSNSQINKSNQKKCNKALVIEDLSDTPDQISGTNSINSRSSSCRQKLKQSAKKTNYSLINESINYNEANSYLDQQTPQNQRSKVKKLNKGSSSKRTRLNKSQEKKTERSQSKTDRRTIVSTVEDFNNSSSMNNFKNLNDFNPSNIIENSLIKNTSSYDKMNEAELSNEIIKIERVLMEMKREYKNLLQKSQEEGVDNIDSIRVRLNEIANEMQQKTEIHGLLKNKQRQLITQT